MHTSNDLDPRTGTGSRAPAAPAMPLRALARLTWLIPLQGALLVWGTWERQPDPTTQFGDWSEFVSTDEFLVSHLTVSIGGQTAAILGTAALTFLLLSVGAHARRALTGFALHTVGSGLLLAGFGIAAFAQPAIGGLQAEHPEIAQQTYDAVFTPLAITTLLAGAALFGLSTIWTGLALGRHVAPWARWAYVAAGPLFAIVGFFIGTVQTIGALALAVAGTAVARAAARDAREH